jgi:hypothetical protein
MGSGGFNRQSYVARQVSSQKKSSGALGGLLFVLFIVVLGVLGFAGYNFIVVLGVLGFAGYKYVEANGLPDLGLEPGAAEAEGEAVPSDMETVVAKLEQIERRLARLEGSRQKWNQRARQGCNVTPEFQIPGRNGIPAVTVLFPASPRHGCRRARGGLPRTPVRQARRPGDGK